MHADVDNSLKLFLWLASYPLSQINLSTLIDYVVECNPDGNITAIMIYTTPRIEYKITKDIEVALYSQFVFQTDEGNIKSAEIYSNRIGFLFSWNFSPKSWFYITFDDYRVNTGNGLEPQERIGAIKAKYLIYF